MNDPRGAMVGDLERRHILSGMVSEEVTRILGKPDRVMEGGATYVAYGTDMLESEAGDYLIQMGDSRVEATCDWER